MTADEPAAPDKSALRSSPTSPRVERRHAPRLSVERAAIAVSLHEERDCLDAMLFGSTASGKGHTGTLIDVSPGGCCVAVSAASVPRAGATMWLVMLPVAPRPVAYPAMEVDRAEHGRPDEVALRLCFLPTARYDRNLLARWMAELAADAEVAGPSPSLRQAG